MNEDFNINDRHEVDDLFRDALGDYNDAPGDAAWSRMSRKLNRKEAVDFITFRKTKVSPQLLSLVPIYRRQWFRFTAIAAVAVPTLFVAGYFIAKNAGTETLRNPQTEQVAPESLMLFNGPDTYAVLEQPEMMRPVNTPTENGTVKSNQPTQSNNFIQDKKNNPQTQKADPQTPVQNIDPKQMLTISEIRDLANDPVIANNLQKLQQMQQKDSIRYHAARIVDSIIQANAIMESQVLQNNDLNHYNSGDLDDLNTSIPTNPDQANSDPIIIIPGAFTPNYDGLNDVLFIDGLEFYPENTLVVHDVTGNIVYSKKEYRGDWNAEGVPDGIYFYFLTYKNRRNVSITIKGVVTIIR